MRKHHDELTGQLQKVQGLYAAKNRSSYSQEIAEGPQAVREALTWASDRVRDIYVTDEVLSRHPDLDRLSHKHWTHVVPADVLSQVSSACQGILVVLNTAPVPSFDEIFTGTNLVVLGVEMQDPGNAGTLIRTADAAGAGGVLFGTGSVDVSSPKVIRVAAGSTYHLHVTDGHDPRTVIARAQKEGFQVLAADSGGETTLGDKNLDLAAPTLWVLGHESRGFGKDILDRADARVAIPIRGKAESLNVATAAAVCLYESVFAREA